MISVQVLQCSVVFSGAAEGQGHSKIFHSKDDQTRYVNASSQNSVNNWSRTK